MHYRRGVNDKMIKRELPLVSILIPNFNYSAYLDKCIQSALNQTYPNKEIVLLDNGSTDPSLQVAQKYVKDGVLVCKNQVNITAFSYRLLANEFCRGEYFILLCSDDYLMPDFIERAVAIMEKYPHVGDVHGEKDFTTAEDEFIETEPFYRCSFVASGRDTMPIYMVTTVAHPAQGVVRKAAFDHIGGYDMEVDHMNADKSLWFYLSYEYDAAYIRDKMSCIRVGPQTVASKTQKDFQHPVLCHLTVKDFVNFARSHNLKRVYEREEAMMMRLAREFVGYAGGMLHDNDMEGAQRYLDYARVVWRDVDKEELYQKYSEMIQENQVDMAFVKQQMRSVYKHKRNYEPPENFEEINPEEIVKWMKQEYRY
jgi:glycosyltransferase involved in cell wall biosynthesis